MTKGTRPVLRQNSLRRRKPTPSRAVLVQAPRLLSELWGRRMAEHAASLVDEVLPRVPVRQWVLTLPYRLRYRLAWDHVLCRAVLGVYAPPSN